MSKILVTLVARIFFYTFLKFIQLAKMKMDIKQHFLTFYNTLGNNEKKTFWLGSITFSIGFIMLLEVLRPPIWSGWQETSGQIISAQNMQTGLFSGGRTLFLIEYMPEDGTMRQGTFPLSPIILSTMKTIRVFYQKDTPSVFYVYNPTVLILAFTALIFGTGVLLSFYLYDRDRLRGITYD